MIKKAKYSGTSKSFLLVLVFVIIAIFGLKLKINETKQVVSTNSKQVEQKTEQIDGAIFLPDSTKSEVSSTFSTNSKLRSNISYIGYIVKTILITVALLILIYAMYYMSKKRLNPEEIKNNRINILERRYLGQKQYLLLIKVDDSKILLGISEKNISMIKEFENYPEESESVENYQGKDADKNSSNFQNILKKIKIHEKL